MMSDADRATARELRRRVAASMPVLEFLVFGSRARGDGTPESDLDVFIVVEVLSPVVRRRISEIAWEVGFEADRIITTILATPDQVGRIGKVSPLMLGIQREGVRP
jgi:uncharacterized protein